MQIDRPKQQWTHFVFHTSLFVLGLAAAILVINVGAFGDEGDNLAGGVLVSQGQMLYRDFFSHHFPFPYLFLGLVFRIFPATLVSARLALVFFVLLIFLFLFFVTKKYILISLTYFFWAMLLRFYDGNMLLYHTFTGITVFGLFVLFMHVNQPTKTTTPRQLSKWEMAGIICLSFIALASDAMAILPVSLLLIGIWIGSRDLKGMGNIGGLLIGLGLWVTLWLLSNHAFQDFIQQAIVFNLKYYARYYSLLKQNWLISYGKILLNAYQIFKPAVWMNSNLPAQLQAYPDLLKSFFGGFYLRFLFLISVAGLLIKKQWWRALLGYLFFGILFFRSRNNFFQQGMVMIAIFLSWHLLIRFVYGLRHSLLSYTWRKLPHVVVQVILIVLIVTFLAGSMFISWKDLWQDPDQLRYETHYAYYEGVAARLKDLACNQVGVQVALYPGDPVSLFLSGYNPVGGYLYMYPWVADYAEEEMLPVFAEGKGKFVIASVNVSGEIWQRPTADFLGVFDAYLAQHYFQTDDGYYISPALYEACQDH